MGLQDNKFYQRWKKWIWGIFGCIELALIIAIAVLAIRDHKSKHTNSSPSQPNYKLDQKYEGQSFFDEWDYYSDQDLAGGFVQYVTKDVAQQKNLTYATDSRAILRVDNSDDDAKNGRSSVRLYSQKAWNSGLFIWDVHHVPFGCGLWPALWLSDPWAWPLNGEIDVFETVNHGSDRVNMALHTTDNCSMKVPREQTGTATQLNCFVNATWNSGCIVVGGHGTAAGSFNDNDGGIMAMELQDTGIRIWQFTRSNIPSDIDDEKPDPLAWGTALADFPGTECNISQHFANLTIIMNIDFCGAWVESDWADSGCPATCMEYVAGNSSAYDDAYFEFGSLKVFAIK